MGILEYKNSLNRFLLLKENDLISLEEKANTNSQNYAIMINGDGLHNDISVALYDYKELIEAWENEKTIGDSVKGLIEFGKTDLLTPEHNPCKSIKNADKIWTVNLSVAVDKLGPMLYDIALILSKKTGAIGLVADRTSLSKDAEQIWINYYNKKQGATGISVDSTPLGEDCPKWKNKNEAVNYIYSTSTSSNLILKLTTNHRSTFKKLNLDRYSKEELETLIWEDAQSLFNQEFRNSLLVSDTQIFTTKEGVLSLKEKQHLTGSLKKHPKFGDYNYFNRNKIEEKGKAPKQRPWHAEAFKKKKLGKIGILTIFLVDGTKIRDLIDDDFADGGNPARYPYIPKNEIWIEEATAEGDLAPFICHEITEHFAMINDGKTYDDAHENVANKYEMKLRDKRKEWENKEPLDVAKEFLKDFKLYYDKDNIINEIKIKIKNGFQINRNDLPQIPQKRIPEFLQKLKECGIDVIKTRVRVGDLKTTQKKINLEKVSKLTGKGYKTLSLENPIIISLDNHIFDGHHRAFALRTIDRNADISAYQIRMHMKDLLEQIESFLPTFFQEDLSNSTPEVMMPEMSKEEDRYKNSKMWGLGTQRG